MKTYFRFIQSRIILLGKTGLVNSAMKIRRSAKIFVQIRNYNHIRRFKGKLVRVKASVNFAQIVKKATCLMAISQHNSNNSLTSELKRASFEKRNNLDELSNIPTKAESRSTIKISFRTQDPNIRQGQSGICAKIHR